MKLRSESNDKRSGDTAKVLISDHVTQFTLFYLSISKALVQCESEHQPHIGLMWISYYDNEWKYDWDQFSKCKFIISLNRTNSRNLFSISLLAGYLFWYHNINQILIHKRQSTGLVFSPSRERKTQNEFNIKVEEIQTQFWFVSVQSKQPTFFYIYSRSMGYSSAREILDQVIKCNKTWHYISLGFLRMPEVCSAQQEYLQVTCRLLVDAWGLDTDCELVLILMGLQSKRCQPLHHFL